MAFLLYLRDIVIRIGSHSKDLKATSGYVSTLDGGTVAWKSSKQTLITRSTMAAELLALEIITGKADWLKGQLRVTYDSYPILVILINCVNQETLAKVKKKKSQQ